MSPGSTDAPSMKFYNIQVTFFLFLGTVRMSCTIGRSCSAGYK